ncbi:asparaginyl-tRNA synthetase [Babesia caballi]|uniref:Asparaginyl-tRNA synthetase n=1 Tax=Babesia caballi TaxID=5871 RepID=A0AAV4LVL4_BABCB|nr:asparaginyl-tRNA synthetase [Babesia caballi]
MLVYFPHAILQARLRHVARDDVRPSVAQEGVHPRSLGVVVAVRHHDSLDDVLLLRVLPPAAVVLDVLLVLDRLGQRHRVVALVSEGHDEVPRLAPPLRHVLHAIVGDRDGHLQAVLNLRLGVPNGERHERLARLVPLLHVKHCRGRLGRVEQRLPALALQVHLQRHAVPVRERHDHVRGRHTRHQRPVREPKVVLRVLAHVLSEVVLAVNAAVHRKPRPVAHPGDVHVHDLVDVVQRQVGRLDHRPSQPFNVHRRYQVRRGVRRVDPVVGSLRRSQRDRLRLPL